ncbi:MAG: hypothetical protein A2W19_06265 [Spirochaetes bacterium RBG_16_49_21]|nr:MAG: hypothetical protein A2W19_06265 [Spirochaetes bacterium RBG_16_49_21]
MPTKTVLEITVSPKSSRQRIAVGDDNSVKAYLTAPPVEGKANAELVGLISKILKIPKSRIRIISGEKNKKKRLQFAGVTREELLSKFKTQPSRYERPG